MAAPPATVSTVQSVPFRSSGVANKLMSNYFENFRGDAYTGVLVIPADKTVRLPHQPCRFAKLANWNTGNDTAFSLKATAGAAAFAEDDLNELYYGFVGNQGGEICFQLFAGRETEMFPINNLEKIGVRARPGNSGVLWYAWFE